MPFVDHGTHRSFYRVDGHADGPTLILSNSLGTDHRMWDPQIAAFGDAFHVVRYDTRGHGQSSAGGSDFTIDDLGRDVLAIADAVSATKFDFCGLSLGGMIGQWIGAQALQRVDRLVLASTSSYLPPRENWNARISAVTAHGMSALLDAVPPRLFAPASLAQNASLATTVRGWLAATDPRGYAGCCAAIRDADLRPFAVEIKAPTLVVAGIDDVATPSTHGEELAGRVSGATFRMLPGAHILNMEHPRVFEAAVLEFLMHGQTHPEQSEGGADGK